MQIYLPHRRAQFRAGGGPALPTTNLYAHWYASAGITKDGSDYVSDWEDQINSLSISQATGSSQPLWVDSAINGEPLLRFDATNDRLTGTWTAIGANSSVYLVFHFNDAGAADAAWHSKTYWGILWGSNAGPSSWYNNGTRSFTGGTNDAWHIIGIAERSGTQYIKVNGDSVQTLAGSSAGTLDNMSIGDRDFLSEPSDVDFAEIVIYQDEHTDSEMQDVHDYLNDKYAIY